MTHPTPLSTQNPPHLSIHSSIHPYTHTHTHTYIYIYIYAHTRTHAHTHAHKQTHAFSWPITQRDGGWTPETKAAQLKEQARLSRIHRYDALAGRESWGLGHARGRGDKKKRAGEGGLKIAKRHHHLMQPHALPLIGAPYPRHQSMMR